MMKTNPTHIHGLLPFWYDFYLPMNCSTPSKCVSTYQDFKLHDDAGKTMTGFNINNNLSTTFTRAEDFGTTTQLTKYRGIESGIYATRCITK